MKFFISLVATMCLSVAAWADSSLSQFMMRTVQQQSMAVAAGVNFHVGDKCGYALDIGGFLQGKMDMSVREETQDGFWIVQNIDMMGQKQVAESLIDKRDGHVIKMIVNGKEQAPPSSDDVEVVKMEQSQVTVPQRPNQPYDAIHVILRNKKDNSNQEAWINPKEIPVNGMLKMLADTQMGQLKAELESFARGS